MWYGKDENKQKEAGIGQFLNSVLPAKQPVWSAHNWAGPSPIGNCNSKRQSASRVRRRAAPPWPSKSRASGRARAPFEGFRPPDRETIPAGIASRTAQTSVKNWKGFEPATSLNKRRPNWPLCLLYKHGWKTENSIKLYVTFFLFLLAGLEPTSFGFG